LPSDTSQPLRAVIPKTPEGVSAAEQWPVSVEVDWVELEFTNNKPNPSLIADADVIVDHSFNAEMGAAAKSLKAIFFAAAGYDQIDPAAIPHSVVVANAYQHEAPIAEWVMAMAVALDHELIQSDRTFRNGDWPQWPFRHGSVRELYGRTFGIIGYGAIGKRVARLANAYDMKVIAAGRRSETATKAEADNVEYGAGQDAMDRVLAESDFVLVSTPLVKSTQGLIGEREIGFMSNDAYLINPARGPIVDEKALYEAVASRSIAGAAIDTWYEYPVETDNSPRPSKYPFWELDNVIMTPHISGATFGTFERRAKTVTANIDRLTRGEPLENVIDELSTS